MLTFNSENHEYRWNGKVVPSVTQVLSPFNDFSMVPRDVLDQKRQIGTAVHMAIELDLAGELDPNSVDDAWAPYFGSWIRFKEESGFIATSSEQRGYSEKYGFAGTLDLLGTLATGPALIDAKSTTMLYPSVGPQTAAYAELIGQPKIPRYALMLGKDGIYKLEPLRDRNDWNVFLASLTVFRFRQAHSL